MISKQRFSSDLAHRQGWMSRGRRSILGLLFAAGAVLICTAGPKPSPFYRDWTVYGGGPDNIHFSSLTQINRQNAGQLQPAWTFDTHDDFPNSEMECNPIVVG